MDVVPDAHVECGTRRSACHSTFRSPANLSVTCLNTQITLKSGIRVAKKLVYYSLSPYISLWETEPPLLCLPCNNVVITLNSWHMRVLLSTTCPLKPPFPLSSSAKGLIVRDNHDKRLRFSVLTCDCFPLDLLLFFFSQLFGQMVVFCISEKCPSDNRNFERRHF